MNFSYLLLALVGTAMATPKNSCCCCNIETNQQECAPPQSGVCNCVTRACPDKQAS